MNKIINYFFDEEEMYEKKMYSKLLKIGFISLLITMLIHLI